MKSLRLRYDGNGSAEVLSGGDDVIDVRDDAERHIEARTVDSLNFADEIAAERSMDARKKRISNFETHARQVHEEHFQAFLRHGRGALEERAQSLTVDSAGGFLVPPGFIRTFLPALKAADPLFDIATWVQSVNGNAATLPLDDDSGEVATQVAENAASITTSAAVFDAISFGKTPTWKSGLIRASLELVADSAFDFAALLARCFARRFAKGAGATFTDTLLGSATLGKTTAAQTVVTPDEIADLMAALDSAFAAQAVFLMNAATFLAIATTKSSSGGNYLAPISTDSQRRRTLFGAPVLLSPSMPAATAGLKSVAYGAMDRFIVREVTNSLTTRAYFERFAEFFQAAYEGYWRIDGQLAVAANSPNPVVYLGMHA